MPDVPSEVKFGEVIGFFTTFLGDSADEGNAPDSYPVEGTVTLTAESVDRIQWGTTTPRQMSLTRPVVLRVVHGQVRGTTTDRAFVVASNQPNGNPSFFQWRATFNFEGIQNQLPSVVFAVPADGVVDLSQVIPSQAIPGVQQVLANPQLFVQKINGVGPDASGNVALDETAGGALPSSVVHGVSVISGLEPRPVTQGVVVWVGGTDAPVNMASRDVHLASSVAAPVSDTQAPAVPTGLAVVSVAETSAVISWVASTDETGVTGYQVRAGNNAAVNTVSTSGTVSGLTAGTAYSFTARARDAAGNWSAWSTAVVGTTQAATAPITTYSIFDPASPYPATLSRLATAAPTWVTQAFYMFGSNAAGYKAIGARLYVPSNVTVGTQALIRLWTGSSASPSQLPTTEAIMANIHAGWNEILFPSETTLITGTVYWLGYYFESNEYLMAPEGAMSSEPIKSAGAPLYLAGASENRIRTFVPSTSAEANARYFSGMDLVIKAGS